MLQRSVGPVGAGAGPAMQRDVLAAADAHAELQALEPIQPPHALLVNGPALTSEQHPDAQEAEPRSHVRDFADPTPQRRLVVRADSGDTTPPD